MNEKWLYMKAAANDMKSVIIKNRKRVVVQRSRRLCAKAFSEALQTSKRSKRGLLRSASEGKPASCTARRAAIGAECDSSAIKYTLRRRRCTPFMPQLKTKEKGNGGKVKSSVCSGASELARLRGSERYGACK